MQQVQAVRGMNDILPSDSPSWNYFEKIISHLAQQYDYAEIRTPVLEKTELFVRSVGEVTDIVEKEMYTFEDRNGEKLSLRPEGTASVVRAALEHSLLYNQIQRVWYKGPMFRHERPQAGRYRQFYQIGFEVFGIADAYIDAELILMTARLWRELGLLDRLTLQLNTLGTLEERTRYREDLVAYFNQHLAQLDDDSRRRLDKNPLRILDSKNPALKEIISNAPALMNYLNEDSLRYFETLKKLLDDNGIAYQLNSCLVRGLDYYTHAVFEWTSDDLGAQATVCAGGRYDGLVEQLGGKSTPAVGCAIGIERILLLLKQYELLPTPVTPWLFIVSVGDVAKAQALNLAEKLRSQFNCGVVYDATMSSFKSQMKRADKSGAEIALIIGEDEVNAGTIAIKFLRDRKDGSMEQVAVPLAEVMTYLEKHKPN